MGRTRRSLVFIPSTTTRIRRVRVRVGVIIACIIVTVIGFAGYFLPFSGLRHKITEHATERKNLTDQNKKLLLRIHTLYQMLHEFGRTAELLTEQKRRVERAINLPQAGVGMVSGHKKGTTISSAALDTVFASVKSHEAFLNHVVRQVRRNPRFFDELPIRKPVSGDAVVTAAFGQMKDPFTGTVKWHYGVDLAAPRKESVNATADGQVAEVGQDRLWGWRVKLQHKHGYVTVYAHLGDVAVVKGQTVKSGQRIGSVGVSGITTGPNVHYEVRLDNRPLDPEKLFFPQIELAAHGF